MLEWWGFSPCVRPLVPLVTLAGLCSPGVWIEELSRMFTNSPSAQIDKSWVSWSPSTCISFSCLSCADNVHLYSCCTKWRAVESWQPSSAAPGSHCASTLQTLKFAVFQMPTGQLGWTLSFSAPRVGLLTFPLFFSNRSTADPLSHLF